jgi:hypothetical protein
MRLSFPASVGYRCVTTMHTIRMLRRTLGLSSDNQVRNRMEQIKDLLADHIRRGPNNQIFLTDPGLGLMRRLQELHETGLTLPEASSTLRVNTLYERPSASVDEIGLGQNRSKREDVGPSVAAERVIAELERLRDQMAQLSDRLAAAEEKTTPAPPASRWWLELREDVDVT